VNPDFARAPFADEQVASLNAYQKSEYVHPYTCGAETCHYRDVIGDDLPMAADRGGLHCINGFGCKYTQTWAHTWTADWSWRRRERREEGRRRRLARRSLRVLRRHMRILARQVRPSAPWLP
jgi:hypothetical protein